MNFKDIVDLPKWRPLATPITFFLNNTVLIGDLRNNEDRHPLLYESSGSILSTYNIKNDQWEGLNFENFLLDNTSGFFMSSHGPRGTVTGGATKTTIPLSALQNNGIAATVGVNQLANRGDGKGFKIRIIGNSLGSSGKTEERYIVANTGETTTPTVTLDSALSFVPANGDTYEFLSGRVFLLGNINVSSWLYYDVLTNAISKDLNMAGLPANWTDSNLVGLDELLVPYDRNPGDGFFSNLTATASGAASLTGQAVGGDASVIVDQYRNFQIRIVQDTGTPTSVGQRRNITSHTGGPSPVYTVPAWTVQPSANAIYVIENNGDRIIAWLQGQTDTFTYSISGDAWDVSVTFAARPVAPTTGLMSSQAFSIEPDVALNARQSFIFSFRSGSNILDLFDIAGAATGIWTANITYGNKSTVFNFSSGGSAIQDPATMQGKYMYINLGGGGQTKNFYRFDMQDRVLEQSTYLRVPITTSGINSIKSVTYTVFIDGSTKLSFIIFGSSNLDLTSPLLYGLAITR